MLNRDQRFPASAAVTRLIELVRDLIRRYRARRAAHAAEAFRLWLKEAQRPERCAAREAENEREYGRITFTTDGFRLDKAGRCVYVVRWCDVREIATYKHDFWAYDMICLGFRAGGDEWCEAWESMPGFVELSDRIRELWPSIPEKWYEDVMLPAFASNFRTLWQVSSGETSPKDQGCAG